MDISWPSAGFKVMVVPSLAFSILLPAHNDPQTHISCNNYPTPWLVGIVCRYLNTFCEQEWRSRVSSWQSRTFFKFLMESFTRMKQNYKSAIYIWYAQPEKYKMQTANLLSIPLFIYLWRWFWRDNGIKLWIVKARSFYLLIFCVQTLAMVLPHS